jgi:WD40 repeat protein
MPVAATQNLFVGPRPISKDEQIFGRDQEVQRLTHLLLAERIVLLHSPSGAGKSSLIHAGFLRAFTEETEDDFYVLPTIRLSITASTVPPGPALFSEAVIRSLERATPADGDATQFDSIEEYLHLRVKKNASGKCVCFVFDQFEECVTFLPGHEMAKSAFFQDLGRTLADSNVWALFAVREDFLAPIIDLGRVLPTRFKETFRLDFLSKNSAREVIQKTANLGHYEFEPEALGRLVDDLAIVNVQGIDGTFSPTPGEYVEPLHLQVACRHILQKLPEGTTKIERRDLERSADGGPRPESSVDEALATYYRNELLEIATGEKALERDLRFWVQENLIDPSGIRIPVRQGARSTEGLDNKIIDKLYDAYLVRRERRLNATWYELAHDRLVPPIVTDNKEWFDRNLGFIGKACRTWIQHGRNPRYLLNQRDLKKELKQYQSNFRWFSPDEAEFVRESTKESKRRRRKALLRVLIPTCVSLALAAFFAALAILAHQKNEALASYSSFSGLRSLYGSWTPGSLDRNVLFVCHLVNKELSDRKTSIDPLFYGDAVSILDRSLDRRGRLLETHWNHERPASDSDVGDRIPVGAVAYSPDGKTLVLGDRDSRIQVLRDSVLGNPIQVHGGKIWALAFSPDGDHLAIATHSRFVLILDLRDPLPEKAVVQLGFPGLAKPIPDVWSCSWNGNGDLAAACQDGKVYVWRNLLRSPQSASGQPSTILPNRLNNQDIPVHAVAWNHTGSLLAMGDAGGTLRFWDGQNFAESIRATLGPIWSLSWSQDGRLACGSWDRSISIWKINSLLQDGVASRLILKQQAHDQWVRDLVWIDHDQAIASVGDDGMLKLWNSADLSDLGPPEQSPTTELWRLSYSASARVLATANDDGAVRIYQLALPRPDTHGDHINTVISLAFSGSQVLSFDTDGALDTFDPGSRKEQKDSVPIDLQSGIRTVRFDSSLNAFVIGYDLSFENRPVKGQLAIWYPLAPLRTARSPVDQPISSVSCHPTAPIVAFLTRNGILGLRTLPEFQPVQPDLEVIQKAGTRGIAKMEWSKAGDTLLVALNREDENASEILRFQFDGKALHLVDTPKPIKIPALIASFAWHPSGQLVAIGTRGGAVILYFFGGEQTIPIVAHDGPVRALNWSVQGDQLFTGGDDRIIKVWAYDPDAKAKLRSITTLRQDKGGIQAIGVCPDGNGIYSAGTDPKVFYWPKARYSIDAILARAKKMINRNMFHAEWLRYKQSDGFTQQEYQKTFDDLPDLSRSESE